MNLAIRRILAAIATLWRRNSHHDRGRRDGSVSAAGMHRYKFQALVTTIAPRQTAVPGPDWRGVIRAANHPVASDGLFSAQVTSWDDHAMTDGKHAIATLVAFGHDPAAALAVGEKFAFWCGRDIAAGVVTRRIFV